MNFCAECGGPDRPPIRVDENHPLAYTSEHHHYTRMVAAARQVQISMPTVIMRSYSDRQKKGIEALLADRAVRQTAAHNTTSVLAAELELSKQKAQKPASRDRVMKQIKQAVDAIDRRP